jgi:hypothetical protein
MKPYVPIIFAAILLGAFLMLLLTPKQASERKEAPEGAPNSFTPTGRFGPDKYGVVCYRYLESIDCVRTQ